MPGFVASAHKEINRISPLRPALPFYTNNILTHSTKGNAGLEGQTTKPSYVSDLRPERSTKFSWSTKKNIKYLWAPRPGVAHIFVSLQYKVSVSESRNFVCLSFSIGGLILDKTISDPNLEGIIVFAPVINGELEHVGSAFLKIVKMHLEGLYMP